MNNPGAATRSLLLCVLTLVMVCATEPVAAAEPVLVTDLTCSPTRKARTRFFSAKRAAARCSMCVTRSTAVRCGALTGRQPAQQRIIGHTPIGGWSVLVLLLAIPRRRSCRCRSGCSRPTPARNVSGQRSARHCRPRGVVNDAHRRARVRTAVARPVAGTVKFGDAGVASALQAITVARSSPLVSFDGGRAFAEAHELSFDVLIVLIAVHVGAILFYLFYDRNDLTRPMLSGRKRVAGEVAGMKRAPAWRLWTGVALATLVVWIIVKE